MTQYNPKAFIDTESGSQLVSRLNQSFEALVSAHAGATAPAYAQAGTAWLDTAASPWLLKRHDGAQWVVEGALDPLAHNFAAYAGGAALAGMATQAPDAVAITGGSIAGIAPLALADGGTGAATAEAARANLGLATGTGPGNVPTVADADARYVGQGAHTIWLPAAAFVPWSHAPCGHHAAHGGQFDTWRGLAFDPVAAEGAIAQLAMPKSWDAGSLTFEVLWAAGAAGAGTVAWRIFATSQGDGDGPPGGWALDGLALNDAAAGAGVTCMTAGAAGPVSGAGERDLLNVLIYRAAGDAADTFAAEAILKGLRVLYTVAAGNDA